MAPALPLIVSSAPGKWFCPTQPLAPKEFMRNLRGTYVHRGDALRRQQRFRQALVLAGFVAACILVVKHWKAPSAAAETAGVDRPGREAAASGFHFDIGQAEGLRTQLE